MILIEFQSRAAQEAGKGSLMKIIALSLAAIVLLSACAPAAPSVEAIQTAIAQTLTAQPMTTSTLAPAPTSTPIAVPTETPPAPHIKATPNEATPAKTSSGKATPGVGLIDINPGDLILSKADFAVEGRYYLPIGGIYGPVTNAEAGSPPALETGKEVARTGRIHGYEAEFARGSSKLAAPDRVWNEVVLYGTAEAARAAVEADANCDRFEGMSPANVEVKMGEAVVACRQDNNGQVDYRLAFSYLNLVAIIEGWGDKAETDPAFFEALAQKQLAIFQAQPLSETVRFVP
jgi:hypothetical protein